jgi:methylmalonyl-CoA/ethylmalonyl-CoA epimerase
MIRNQNMSFHHIGCLTDNMEESILGYKDGLGFRNISRVFSIADQQVKVCFIETGPGAFLELVQPIGDNVVLKKILKSRNPYYHIGYLVSDIEECISRMQDEGGYLVNKFRSEAFEHKWCAFLYTKEMHLIELIER